MNAIAQGVDSQIMTPPTGAKPVADLFSVVVASFGVGIQFLIAAVSWGKIRSETTSNAKQITELQSAIKDLTHALHESTTTDHSTEYRLKKIEDNAEKIDAVTRELQRFSGAQDVENRNFRQGFEKVDRGLASINRQLANMVGTNRPLRPYAPGDDNG